MVDISFFFFLVFDPANHYFAILYYELIRLPKLSLSPSSLSTRRKFTPTTWGLPSSNTDFSRYPSTVFDPGRTTRTHHFVHVVVGFQYFDTLALCIFPYRGSIPSLALWMNITFPLSSIRFVTSTYAEFRSDLVVSLLSGWIVYLLSQLVCISFAWRTKIWVYN